MRDALGGVVFDSIVGENAGSCLVVNQNPTKRISFPPFICDQHDSFFRHETLLSNRGVQRVIEGDTDCEITFSG